MAKVTLDWYRFGHLLVLLVFTLIGGRCLMESFELGRLTAYGISTTIVTSTSNMLMKFFGIADGDGSNGGQCGDATTPEQKRGTYVGNPKKKQKRRTKRE
uniref:Uncharacterized protein n=1 Tax=Minutocellus polymorphus TaxID=265543 RepID=A0A6U0JIF9_9STRA|mmetsp:Transcript_8649/g.24295  ORF Transcript_8649/g.24295 Transcript_8649/m.24295 type:complete len:100 (+) Transcript_8649:304-603(+)|eukprot:CAMPEP_0181049190 /NCGR_PEP_ID=MMETSP1070-20121207/15841_1 /TAXON_ID=265543 /ORGANISM="Minutocellus polymorphus, Strain NH13" /LENGTH=99 /DNA_ID=CAMNT_0023128033 /DNA_START=301 /DNA_END=600 /DNA_ORIENTATION=-